MPKTVSKPSSIFLSQMLCVCSSRWESAIPTSAMRALDLRFKVLVKILGIERQALARLRNSIKAYCTARTLLGEPRSRAFRYALRELRCSDETRTHPC